MSPKEIAENAYKFLDEKKAVDIKVIDISKVSVIADYFIICGANNARMVKSLADNVEQKLGAMKVAPRSVEGYETAKWILMDYNDVIIHIFNQEERLFYDLERIWSDGKVVEEFNDK
ncbi:MAG: ribosome silencing factor [Parasporobacterium sp.]|nr:ribosome silencing factor [Parasporobacterium sp.]